jgi:ribosomal protein S27E
VNTLRQAAVFAVAHIARQRMTLYYWIKGMPHCGDCGHQTARVFHADHAIPVKPHWWGLPVACLQAAFTHMPTVVRCPMCHWLHERNLNA